MKDDKMTLTNKQWLYMALATGIAAGGLYCIGYKNGQISIVSGIINAMSKNAS